MKDFLESVTSLIPVLQSSPVWVKMYFTGWLFATVGLIISVIFAPAPQAAAPIPPKTNVAAPINRVPPVWPMTGDNQIDDAHQSLNSIATTQTPTEAQLVSALRYVFYKPIFQHILEDVPGSALFTFCRAQLLLQTYVSEFDSPGVRLRIVEATQNLISLQDQLGQLYGPTFRRERQCGTRAATLAEYTSTLPPRQNDLVVGPQFDKAQRTLDILRDNLRAVNLKD